MIKEMMQGADSSRVKKSGNYITTTGAFRVKTDNIVCAESAQTEGRMFVHYEFTVLESSCPDEVPVGAQRTWTGDMTRVHGSGSSKRYPDRDLLKQLLEAHNGGPMDDETESAAYAALDSPEGAGDLFEGTEIDVQTTTIKTKEKNDFTKFFFSPVE
jgi:hypothetical protein